MADRLHRRGLPYPAASPLCDQEPESIQHLFLGCAVAREIWAWALPRWGKMERMPSVDTELLQWWSSLTCPPRGRRDLWTAVIYSDLLVHLEASE
jgi:hypothetical protein